MTDRLLTIDEVMNIPETDLPLIVLSRNYYSHFATEISEFQGSIWNHFMWAIHPGKVVTQGFLFKDVDFKNYLTGKHQLKFWTSSKWTSIRRLLLTRTLEDCLNQPWYLRRYDFLQILGIKLHIRKLQIPWLKICSDWADEIKLMDKTFLGEHMTPGEVNEWCKKQDTYSVYGRFYPND